jgi:uncharacterized protein (TIGR02611 family)
MTESSHQGARERFEKFEQAAIKAEFETGRQEETESEAKRHILIRIGRVTLGVIVLVAGLLMLPLPGPGLVTIAAGLALLASDVPYARKLLENVRKRLPADSQGNVSRPVVLGGLVVSVITVSFTIWWTFFR